MLIQPRMVEALLCSSLDQVNVSPGLVALRLMGRGSVVRTLKVNEFAVVKVCMAKCKVETLEMCQLIVLRVVGALTPPLLISLLL